MGYGIDTSEFGNGSPEALSDLFSDVVIQLHPPNRTTFANHSPLPSKLRASASSDITAGTGRAARIIIRRPPIKLGADMLINASQASLLDALHDLDPQSHD